MTGFSDPILTGDGSLIRKSAKSPNYLIGTTGWSINQDGTAEFNNVTARGTAEVDGPSGNYVRIYNDPTNGAIIAMEPATTPAATTPALQITQWVDSGNGPQPHVGIQAPEYNGHGHAALDLSGTNADGTSGTRAQITADNVFLTGHQNVNLGGGTASLQVSQTATNVSGDLIISAGQVYATDPVNGGTETWHRMTLQNGWTNNSGTNEPASYRLVASPAKCLQIVASIIGGTTAAGGVTIAQLPAGYYSTTRTLHFHLTPFGVAPGAGMEGFVTTGGAVTITATTGATRLDFNAILPLDL